MLKSRGSVNWPRLPHSGQLISCSPSGARPFLNSNASSSWSARNRLWQLMHSVSGSENTPTWPEATQTCRGRMIEESMPTTSARPCTMVFHHWRLMFSFSSTPYGP